jgi:hypothetical protein
VTTTGTPTLLADLEPQDVDAEAAALARKVAEALEAGTGHLLGETERVIIYRVLRDGNVSTDAAYCEEHSALNCPFHDF